MGGGIRLRFSERFAIGAELGGRITFTDYLDDLSETRVNYAQLERERGEPIAQLSNPSFTGEQAEYRRGNGAKDYYYTGGITLFYNLNNGALFGTGRNKTGCYKF
jgi:hypothetical protein